MRYVGSCHCGDNRFELTTPKTNLGTYAFNKHVIEHYFCKRCGVAPFGYGEAPNGLETVAVNIRCLENVDLEQVQRQPFDGRSLL